MTATETRTAKIIFDDTTLPEEMKILHGYVLLHYHDVDGSEIVMIKTPPRKDVQHFLSLKEEELDTELYTTMESKNVQVTIEHNGILLGSLVCVDGVMTTIERGKQYTGVCETMEGTMRVDVDANKCIDI